MHPNVVNIELSLIALVAALSFATAAPSNFFTGPAMGGAGLGTAPPPGQIPSTTVRIASLVCEKRGLMIASSTQGAVYLCPDRSHMDPRQCDSVQVTFGNCTTFTDPKPIASFLGAVLHLCGVYPTDDAKCTRDPPSWNNGRAAHWIREEASEESKALDFIYPVH
ncbi:hypothetical protein C8R43DRAFT_949895 [Mycena crocata]|nr:hypothetical protein C8R43DRAFT_949895 [Mycena crocata]